MTLDLETLDRTPAEGARVVSLALLADVTDAAARLGDGADEEALHDFRVAMRRLRSTLRAWRPVLGDALRKKDERRLRKIARATNSARDSEVLLGWLGEVLGDMAESHRRAARWVASRVEQRRLRPDPVAQEKLGRLALRLSSRLSRGGGPHRPEGETFASALTARVRAQARLLREALARVSSPEDVLHAHRARIEGKRLRYLMEPLRGTPLVDSGAAVQVLKSLQDLLGELHDAHVAASAIASARLEAAAERARGHGELPDGPGLRPGLLALERLAQKRARKLFERLEEEVLAKKGVSVLDPVYAVAQALEERTAGAQADPPAPRRRFLLSELPDRTHWGTATEIEKGWLQGDGRRECYGRARSPKGETYFRTISGKGGRRARDTEEIASAVFEAFWPLTEGQRVHKRCYLAPGEPGWRFDEYLDRQLALAVAEPGNEAPLPAWLEPYLVREVTGERGYHDDLLARRAPRGARARPAREDETGAAPTAPAGEAAEVRPPEGESRSA